MAFWLGVIALILTAMIIPMDLPLPPGPRSKASTRMTATFDGAIEQFSIGVSSANTRRSAARPPMRVALIFTFIALVCLISGGCKQNEGDPRL